MSKEQEIITRVMDDSIQAMDSEQDIKEEARIYVNAGCYESTDPETIEFMKKLRDLANTDIEKYGSVLKRYCWMLRRKLNIDNLLWCTLSKDDERVVIFTFPVEATLNNFASIRIDEDGKPYMVLSEIVIKEECQL